MKDNKLDLLIKYTYREFKNEMDIHSNLEIPNIKVVMDRFRSNLQKEKKSSKLSKNFAMVAAFTIVMIISTFISSIPKVIAFKFNIVKSFEELRGDTKDIKFSTKNDMDNSLSRSKTSADQIEKIVSLDEAKKGVSFKLLVPEYMPSGYKLKNVKLIRAMGDYFSVNLTYINNKGKMIQIYQSTISDFQEETISMSTELSTKDITVKNLIIKLATDNKNFKNMIWIDNNIKFEMLVPYDVTDNEAKRIIELLK